MYESIVQLITILGIIAVAVERSNEIVISGFNLDGKLQNINDRRTVYQLMSAITGALIYFLNLSEQSTLLTQHFNQYVASAIAGLLVSAGSSFWHDILKYVTGLSLTSKKTVL